MSMEKRLSDLQFGEKAIVKKIPKRILSQVSGMGLRVNKPVELSSKQPMNGPLTLTIGSSSISVGRNFAEQIIIEVD